MEEHLRCRACFMLVNPQRSQIFQLTDTIKNHKVTLAQMLWDCTGLFLIPETVSKEIICVTCKRHLINFYDFKRKVLEADNKFKENPSNVVIKVEATDEFSYQTAKKIKRNRSTEPSRKENLKKYKRNADDLYECPLEECSGVFKKLGRLEIHLETMHSETQDVFTCKHCGDNFPTLLLEKRHFYKIHAPRPFICDICGNDYPFLDSLRTHMRFHVNGQRQKTRHACTICDKLFTSEQGMIRHRKTLHFPKELVPKPYICNVCGSKWATKCKLIAHMKYHATPEFTCEICSKSFCMKGTLMQHKLHVHTDLRPFFCDICGKTYKAKNQLQNHQTSHKEARPFACPKCPSTFKTKGALQEHESKSHTTAAPSSCETCGKVFKGKSCLRKHMKQHISEDLKCPRCTTTYKDKSMMRFHIRTIHMGFKKRHACPFPNCSVNLSSRKQIVDHLEQVHKEFVETSTKAPEDLVQSYWTSDPSGANMGEGPPYVKFE